MRLWTLQAPEVVRALRSAGSYQADWELVIPNWRPAFQDMVEEMRRRGIDCAAAPPIWCWRGRARQRRAVRSTANSLLGDHEWAHGRWLLTLDVPDKQILATSYAAWNDYLGFRGGYATDLVEGPHRMDWTTRLHSPWDAMQYTIPELRLDWLVRARAYPPDTATTARILADPYCREIFERQRAPELI
ncbi:DUF3841 domain-containing protein [Nocardia goodfellowii]|uniref:DUF3841 domain-containing protein n=1 Tax=Nocardia goodfellowii TaxID=882446 RepID=A0ABS4QGD5_9NOCA|nr:DUF3841 domain-containing protein [Nocardia goodfellowii]MBP2190758.1 hypothetical protein [Nocardia goodfellowii]